MEKYSVAIIGGGASGINLATLLKQAGVNSLCILERNDRIGKKLIATGNGQGNLTNKNVGKDKYFSSSKNFVDYAVETYGFEDISNFYSQVGVKLVEGEEGKCYPNSKQASSVLDTFMQYLEYKKTTVKTDFEVVSVKKENGLFKIEGKNRQTVYSDICVLATGGNVGKQFGTDGTAYKLATDFGHKLTKLSPSLVQLKTEKDKIKALKGLKADVNVSAIADGKYLRKESGEILFTDYGVSGNAIFKISAFLTDCKEKEISVEFLPNIGKEELETFISLRRQNQPYIKEEDLLIGLVNKMIGRVLVRTARSTATKDIVLNVKNFKLKVVGNLGENYAQVTHGGIYLKDIDNVTYESKIVRNLYILGEELDVDGECGGYNLHFAYASSKCASVGIINKLNAKSE